MTLPWSVAISGAVTLTSVVVGIVFCLPCKVTLRLGKQPKKPPQFPTIVQ